ncbi:MAG: FKBP-type peptidyl-prolyl cis-trans isomerase [Aggregatilineales bacterium]
MDTIQNGLIVSLAYTLKLQNGDLIDYSDADDPLEYLHGAENIIPGLERELTGLHTGDTKDVQVKPEDGYGEYDPEEVEVIERKLLPRDMEMRLGMVLAIRDEEGHLNEAYVRAIAPDSVTLDFNHPLAGQPLFFNVEVIGVREATPEELAHGHPHSLEMDEEEDFEDEDFDDEEEFDDFELEIDDFDDEDDDLDDDDLEAFEDVDDEA